MTGDVSPLRARRRTAVRLGRIVRTAMLLLIGASLGGWPARAGSAKPVPANTAVAAPVVIVRLDDTVQAVSAEYVTRGLAFAQQRGAAAVVLVLNTPGGLDSAMRDIIQHILASPVPVIGYVAPSGARSASAGFYILMSCDVAAMAPGTNIGAAHPVVLGQQPGKIEAEKIQSDAAAFIRSLASQRHRNLDLAQKAVLESQSFTEQEALQGGLIDVVAPSLTQLLATLNGRSVSRAGELSGQHGVLRLAGAPRLEYAMSLRERILDMNPSLAFALLAFGALLIYVEFTHPGVILPGVAGLVLVVVSLFALSFLPISWAGAGLLILALILFGAEIKFHSGVLALGGIAAMALGAMMLVDGPIPQLRVEWSVALGVAVGFGVVSLLLVHLVLRARRHRVVTGAQGLVGETGMALEPLEPNGTVLVHGERWQAAAVSAIPAGTRVRVRAVRGLELEVEVLQESTGRSIPAGH